MSTTMSRETKSLSLLTNTALYLVSPLFAMPFSISRQGRQKLSPSLTVAYTTERFSASLVSTLRLISVILHWNASLHSKSLHSTFGRWTNPAHCRSGSNPRNAPLPSDFPAPVSRSHASTPSMYTPSTLNLMHSPSPPVPLCPSSSSQSSSSGWHCVATNAT